MMNADERSRQQRRQTGRQLPSLWPAALDLRLLMELSDGNV
jgi:hypothetical protein